MLGIGIIATGDGTDTGLSRLGDSFLQRFKGSSLCGPLCSDVGVMAGEHGFVLSISAGQDPTDCGLDVTSLSGDICRE